MLNEGYRGIKTGYTTTAGGCLSSITSIQLNKFEEQELLIVLLGSNDSITRFEDSRFIVKDYQNYLKMMALWIFMQSYILWISWEVFDKEEDADGQDKRSDFKNVFVWFFDATRFSKLTFFFYFIPVIIIVLLIRLFNIFCFGDLRFLHRNGVFNQETLCFLNVEICFLLRCLFFKRNKLLFHVLIIEIIQVTIVFFFVFDWNCFYLLDLFMRLLVFTTSLFANPTSLKIISFDVLWNFIDRMTLQPLEILSVEIFSFLKVWFFLSVF